MIPCEQCEGTGLLDISDYDSFEDTVVRRAITCPVCRGSGERESTDDS